MSTEMKLEALKVEVTHARAAANSIAGGLAIRDSRELVRELARAVEELAVATSELIRFIDGVER